ncbi:threonine ammonia-lyase [Roseibium sediminicola]|uniref:Threonine/serine dehydratase n=1 Tax=Roseibium sediminicola TaxID=2933272 RepID=A0ABT0H1H3_9HYPH|nr:threonine/serine dehydratase [Roseibium sp. CAU 1639]MCK7614923.1 threonine/serine dehydratase [Roseibium sp. CAU 1639]
MADIQSQPLAEDVPDLSGFAVSIEDIEAAAGRIDGQAVKTPVLRHPLLDERTGARVLIKPENLQRSGSFKFRGAFNRLNLIPEADRPKGVVACSSGNHAQGVAASAQLLGMPATIVMPEDAPQIKLERTRGYGATVVTYDRETESRDAIAKALCDESGATFVHPYNDPGVIAGQGTVGLELAAQAAALGLPLDDVLACTGGGGLASGIAVALAHKTPQTRFHTAEPALFDDYKRSLESGTIQTNAAKSGSVCDALLTEAPGEVSFSILRELAGEAVAVTDEEALAAVAFAFSELKLVVEPGGAVALAALLTGKLPLQGQTVGVVLTGGNIDPQMLMQALGR